MFVYSAGLEAYYEFLLSWAIFIILCISSVNDVRYLTLFALWNHIYYIYYEIWVKMVRKNVLEKPLLIKIIQ